MGQKTSDLSAIPLCSAHHRENPDSYHRLGEQVFSREHGLALQELVRALRSRFWQQDAFPSSAVHPLEVAGDDCSKGQASSAAPCANSLELRPLFGAASYYRRV
jgi:hypothetical protein